MQAEIIAVGSEMLTPARVDTNSLVLTERLNRRGIEVVRKTIIGDDRTRLSEEIARSLSASEIVILTGGLGPTLDDLTREAVADAIGVELEFHPEIVEELEARFSRFGRPMAENNKRQAYVLAGAEVLPNPNGTAPGQWVERDGRVLMLLPGPPRELRPMFEEQCEQRLDRIESPYQYATVSLRVSGLGESDVDQRIGPIYSSEPRVATTILAAPGDIQLHLRGRAVTEEEARSIAEALAAKIADELKDHVYSWTNEPIEVVVGNLLRERSLRLGLAESCTGGMLSQWITAHAGCSDFFAGSIISYSEDAKIGWLGVAAETIASDGVVSEATAREMAERARDLAGGASKAVGLSVTGVAGPDGGSEETPVGTVYLGVADEAGTLVKHRVFGGRERDRNRMLAAQTALELLRRRLLGIL